MAAVEFHLHLQAQRKMTSKNEWEYNFPELKKMLEVSAVTYCFLTNTMKAFFVWEKEKMNIYIYTLICMHLCVSGNVHTILTTKEVKP